MSEHDLPPAQRTLVDSHIGQIVEAARSLGPHRVYDETTAQPTGVRNIDDWGADLAALMRYLVAIGPQPTGVAVKTIATSIGLRGNANHIAYLPYFGPVTPISYLIGLRNGRLPPPDRFVVASYVTRASGDWRFWGISTLRAPGRPAGDHLRGFYDRGMPPPPAPFGKGRYGSVTLCVVWAVTSNANGKAWEVPVDAFWWIPTSNFDPRCWCSQALERSPSELRAALQRQASLPRDVQVRFTGRQMFQALVERLELAVDLTSCDDVFAVQPWTGLELLTCDSERDIKKHLLPTSIVYGDDIGSLRVFQHAGYDVFGRCEVDPGRVSTVTADFDTAPRSLLIDDRPLKRVDLGQVAFAPVAQDPRAQDGLIWTRSRRSERRNIMFASGTFRQDGIDSVGTIFAAMTHGTLMGWCTLVDLTDERALHRAIEVVHADASQTTSSEAFAAATGGKDLVAAGDLGTAERIRDAVIIPGTPNATARETRARWPLLREQLQAMIAYAESVDPAARSQGAEKSPRADESRELRRFERRQCVLPAFVRDDNSHDVVGRTVNLSRGGMLLAGHGEMQASARVRFTLALDGETVTGGGQVVRCESLQAAEEGEGQRVCAVQFAQPLDRLPASTDR